MQSTQMEVKQYKYFAGNEWRNATDEQVFEVHEPYSGKLGGVRDSGWAAQDLGAWRISAM